MAERRVNGAHYGADEEGGSVENGSPSAAPARRATVSSMLTTAKVDDVSQGKKGHLGIYSGVLIPTCENMWGVLIFLRFYYIVGNAGIWQTILVVFTSFACALLTSLSLSAVATNGPIEEGGTYYLISRALGPRIGGAVGCMYYLGVVLLAVLEALGAVEMLLFTFPALEISQAARLWGALTLILLGVLVFLGIKFVSRLGIVFFAIVLYTMASYYIGLGVAPKSGLPPEVTGLSWNTFRKNWGPGYADGADFSVVLSVFFPCFTGILSGADRASSLRDPAKSIPMGTLGAITLSLVMYLSYFFLWGAVALRPYLLGQVTSTGEPGGGGHGNIQVVPDIVWPLPIITQLGIIVASIAQALQCLITSPRLLQAISADGIVPFLAPVAKLRNGEPQRALLLTVILSVAASMIGSLDLVAPLVSICFLTCYTALNLSCFVFSILKAPSWRPKWHYYHWSTALLGFFACFAMMFAIVWYWALATLLIAALLYVYIDYRQVEVDWGTGLGGLRLQLAVQSILSVGHESQFSVNWRPQLLVLMRLEEDPKEQEDSDAILAFAAQLKKGKGLCVVTAVLEGRLVEAAKAATLEREELEKRMEHEAVTGFACTLVAKTFRNGKTLAIQGSGLGRLEPNTLLLAWPHNWREAKHQEDGEVLLETLEECTATGKAALLCKDVRNFPRRGERLEGFIDVWWIVHDGGLLLLLAHLLQQHRVWKGCRLRVHTVAEQLDNSVAVKENLKQLLQQVRIEAEVDVVEMADEDLAPYTYDYTLRVEEAQAHLEELKRRRKKEKEARAQAKKDTYVAIQEEEQPVLEKKKSNLAAYRPFPQELHMVDGAEHISRRPSVMDVDTGAVSAVDDTSSSRHVRRGSGSDQPSPRGAKPRMMQSDSALGTKKSPLSLITSTGDVELETVVVDERTPKGKPVLTGILPRGERRVSVLEPEEVNGGGGEGGPESGPGGKITLESLRAAMGAEDGGEREDPLSRTWNTFTKAHTPSKLNELIVEQSQDAELVLINLPDPFMGMDANEYMAYCEELTQGLRRVLLVHGTGKEIWSGALPNS